MSEYNPFEEGSKGFSDELVPAGAHRARCVRLIEIGKQYSARFDSEANKVVVVFSLPDILVEINGEMKQKFMSNGFGETMSNSDKSTLRKWARALCPNGGSSLGDMLNRPCQIIVRHDKKNDKTYANIDAVAPILPGTEVPELDTEPFWFKWNTPDPEIYTKIPPYIQDKIKGATNYEGSLVQEMVLSIENAPVGEF